MARTSYHLLSCFFLDTLLGIWGILPYVSIPSDFLSLHQRAGYSLQELFHLTRSQVSQQRALALHVLSQIIGRVSGLLLAWSYLVPPHPLPLIVDFLFTVGQSRNGTDAGSRVSKGPIPLLHFTRVSSPDPKAQAGEFGDRLVGSILRLLLDAGFLFLLRFSLDDRVDGVIAAAVRALRALLVAPGDEVCQGWEWVQVAGSALHPSYALCQGSTGRVETREQVAASSQCHKPGSLGSAICMSGGRFCSTPEPFLACPSLPTSARSSLTAPSLGIMELRCSL